MQLSDSYLYKDLLSFGGIRKPELLEGLLRALALQVGSEVSYNELSRLLQVDKNTVSNYVDLLEKAYIIFKLPAFSRNPRKEITRGKKIYFYDNGIRNAVLSNYQPLDLRTDKGAIWENFLMSERRKSLHYRRVPANFYFWRSKRQSEIDLVEEHGGKIVGYEFKWSPAAGTRLPESFIRDYEAEVHTIQSENFHDFASGR